MEFFRATQGTFLRTRLYGDKYMELAERLRIVPLSEEQLVSLERAYGISDKFFGPFGPEYEEADKIFMSLRNISTGISDYLRSFYWEDTPAQQIVTLIACCKRIKEMKQSQASRGFLLMYALSSLALSVVRFSKNLLVIPDNSKEEFIKIELLGGVLEHNERKELLKAFYSFMTRLRRSRKDLKPNYQFQIHNS